MSDNNKRPPPETPYRHLPGIDTLLRQNPELLARWGHEQLSMALRAGLALLRQRIDQGEQVNVDINTIRDTVAAQLESHNQRSLQPVLNLSGTILHTNLGRACLPETAVEAVIAAARYPSNLEFDLGSGKRGRPIGPT